jgi:hypothetical protein
MTLKYSRQRVRRGESRAKWQVCHEGPRLRSAAFVLEALEIKRASLR